MHRLEMNGHHINLGDSLNFSEPLDVSQNSMNSDEININKYRLLPIVHGSYTCLGPTVYYNDQRSIIKFNKSDHLILPKSDGVRLLNSPLKNFIIKIWSIGTNIETYGRAVSFDAPDNCIIMPEWMIEQVLINYGDAVMISTVNICKLDNVKIKVPKCMNEPTTIIEYELRDHSVLYTGKRIQTGIFNKKYNMIIVDSKPSFVGMINNSDIKLDIEYE